MVSKITTAVCSGIDGCIVTVETDIANGLPCTNIVGLASTTIKESSERVKSAIDNSGFSYPMRRITINLTPAALRKTGTHLDLPIAIGILAAAGIINYGNERNKDTAFIGELALDGRVLPVEGVLPMAKCLRENGIRKLVIPEANMREAALVRDLDVYGITSLPECMMYLEGRISPYNEPKEENDVIPHTPDFADVKGQDNAKRALTISAAGEHGIVLIGNPGCGKSMLSRRIPSILPKMTEEEIIESTIIYSVAGQIDNRKGFVATRPFRMPHYSIRKAGLIGGGTYPMPGEITLAHNGVLFLDEATEFDRETIESLRTPIEDREIIHSRRGKAYRFPSNFLLVMAANPCKCGYYGDPEHECTCSRADIELYKRKLSGAFMERIDMQVLMEKITYEQMSEIDAKPISSSSMKEDVERARAFAKRNGRLLANSRLTDDEISMSMHFGESEIKFMNAAYKKYALSPRTYMKTLRVARTIADMEESEKVTVIHLSEALTYRNAVDKIHD